MRRSPTYRTGPVTVTVAPARSLIWCLLDRVLGRLLFLEWLTDERAARVRDFKVRLSACCLGVVHGPFKKLLARRGSTKPDRWVKMDQSW